MQTDTYAGYNGLFIQGSKRISVGCWAHVRRKFMDVIKAQGKKLDKLGYADIIMKKIQQLYEIERVAKEAESTPDFAGSRLVFQRSIFSQNPSNQKFLPVGQWKRKN